MKTDIQATIKAQKNFFNTNITKDYNFRLRQLKRLKAALLVNEEVLFRALKKDLGKSSTESFMTEVGFVIKSISYAEKNLKKWMKPKRVRTDLHLFPAKNFIYHEPFGSVLIIGPFNYPLHLLLEPLIGAIAAGNCAVLKPSENAPHTANIVEKIITKAFPEKYLKVVQGSVKETSELINSPFDFIFFTGSPRVGKIVMKAAANNLTPVCLELGGKSPAIIDKTANLKQAANRIAYGKFLNTGQTCVAPDYVLVAPEVKDRFIKLLIQTLHKFYGDNFEKSPDYGRIINEKETKRLIDLINTQENKIIFGGKYDLQDRFVGPTIMDNCNWNDPVMQEEIFGPILPIITMPSVDEAIKHIKSRPKPLALYMFSKDKDNIKKVLNEVSFGSGAINSTILQLSSQYLPFGGVGNSGMGMYHGRYTFDLFSHSKSILTKSTGFDPSSLFTPPYKKWQLSFLKKYFK